MHDRDTKFTKSFDEMFAGKKSEVKISAFRSPNTCAFVERFIQTIKQECLDHFVVFGRIHFGHICEHFVEHYHLERPHQSHENDVLPIAKGKGKKKAKEPSDGSGAIPLSQVHCKERLGGLLKHYSRKAA